MRTVHKWLNKEQLESLLKWRQKEYAVFWRSSEDNIYDVKIINRIKELW